MKPIVLVPLALLLGGCVFGPKVPDLAPAPSPAELATPAGTQAATAVNLPIAACKQRQVQHPARPGMNARVALRLTNHALSVANGHIINGNSCIDQVVSGYASGLTASSQ